MSDKWLFRPAPLTQKEIDLFYLATYDHIEYNFEPISVAKSEISDTHFRFLGIISPICRCRPIQYSIINIYKPNNGRPYITSFTIVDVNQPTT